MTDNDYIHSFSLVMCSKRDISKIIISEEPLEEVLIQGDFGDLVSVRMVEGVMLEIHGDKGIFRVDLSEDELWDGLKKQVTRAEVGLLE